MSSHKRSWSELDSRRAAHDLLDLHLKRGARQPWAAVTLPPRNCDRGIPWTCRVHSDVIVEEFETL